MKKTIIFIFLTLILITSLVVSCGEETTTTTTTSQPSPTQTQTPNMTTSTSTTPTGDSMPTDFPAGAEYGGVLKRWLPADVGSPIGVPWEMTPYGHGMAMPALEHIMYEDGDGNMAPYLAVSWDIAQDNLSITLKLRQGVKFHDGTDWNAEACKWNFDKWLEIGMDSVSSWDSVDIIDTHTIRINLIFWDNTIMTMSLAGWNSEIISPTSFEDNGVEWARYHPVGTGPFKFASYERDVNLVYEKNDDYWQPGKPFLDGIEYVVIPDMMTAYLAFQSGDVHELSSMPPNNISAELLEAGYFMADTTNLVNTIDCMFFDSGNPDSPFADKRVREAFEYAINKEELVAATGFGFLMPAYQLAPHNNRAYQTDLVPRTYDPDKARQLLAEAGYSDGFETTVMPNVWIISKDTMVAIQRQVADVGINLNVDMADFGKFTEAMYVSGWDGMLCEKTGLFPSLTKGFKFYFAGDKFFSLQWPEGFREAYDEALSTREVDVDKVKEVLRILYEDATILPFQETPMRTFLNHGVHEPDVKFDIPPYTVSESAWMEKSIQ